MIDEEDLLRLALDRSCHALPMARSQNKGFENKDVERPLQQGDPIIGVLLGSHPTQALHYSGRMSTRVGRNMKINRSGESSYIQDSDFTISTGDKRAITRSLTLSDQSVSSVSCRMTADAFSWFQNRQAATAQGRVGDYTARRENRLASLGIDRKVITPLMRSSHRPHRQNSKFSSDSLQVSCLIEDETSGMITRSHSVSQTLPTNFRDGNAVEAAARYHLGVGSPTRRTSSPKRGSEWRLSKRSSTVR